METLPIQDQLANISPVWVVGIVAVLTMLRVALAKSQNSAARTISETCDTINFVLILTFLLIRPFVAQAFYIPSESMESTLLVRDRLMVNRFEYRFSEPKRGDVIVFEAPPKATGGRNGVDFIKRLICLPGDTIQVKSAKLFLDGEEVDVHNEAAHLHDYLRNRLGLTQDNALKIFPDHVLVDGKDKITKERIAELLGRAGAEVKLVPGQTLRNGEVLNEPYTREDPDYDYPGDGSAFRVPKDCLFVMGDNRNRSADSHMWNELEAKRVVGKAWFLYWPLNRIRMIK